MTEVRNHAVDIDAIQRYWESELILAGGREPSVAIVDSAVERTWIWSDLHLSDRGALEAFDQPFVDPRAMNRHLLARGASLCGRAIRPSASETSLTRTHGATGS